MLDIDVIGAGADKGSWVIVGFLGFWLHTAEGHEGLGDLILSLHVKVVGTRSHCGVSLDVGHYLLSSKDKCH